MGDIKLRDDRSWIVKALGILLLILILGLGLLFLSNNLHKPASPSKERAKKKKTHKKIDYASLIGRDHLTLLLLGVDITWTPNHLPTTKASRSDTIMVVRIDFKKKYIGLLSIPRDLRVYLPEYHRYVKINTCNVLGGPHYLQKVIKREFNIHTDYVIVVKQEAVKELVDLIGGLDIYVEKNMDYEDKWGRFKVHLKKGFQRLNGEQVIGYMRFRMDAEGDLGRIRRQQQVIRELKRQLPEKLKGTDLPKLITILYKYIRTDLKPKKAMLIARFLKDYAKEITFRSATIPVVPIEIDGISYVKVKDKNLLWETEKYILKDYPPLQLLNGTDTPGLAHRVYKKFFKNSPFAVLSITNATTPDHLVTLILYSQDHITDAYDVKEILGFGEIKSVEEYLYSRLGNPNSELYIMDPFLWRYTRRLNMANYNVNVILGKDALEVVDNER